MLDEVSATDVVLFRPPMALWGYSTQATDEALNRIAEALTERDIEITALRQRVANLEAASPPGRSASTCWATRWTPGPRTSAAISLGDFAMPASTRSNLPTSAGGEATARSRS